MDIGNPNSSAIWVSEEGYRIKKKVLNIGVWNMDVAGGIAVAHGLGARYTHIVNVITFVRDDAGSIWCDLSGFENIGDPFLRSGGTVLINGTNIELARRDGGRFDNVGYNDVGINRGICIIEYYE